VTSATFKRVEISDASRKRPESKTRLRAGAIRSPVQTQLPDVRTGCNGNCGTYGIGIVGFHGKYPGVYTGREPVQEPAPGNVSGPSGCGPMQFCLRVQGGN
jgi:hypothetical protein